MSSCVVFQRKSNQTHTSHDIDEIRPFTSTKTLCSPCFKGTWSIHSTIPTGLSISGTSRQSVSTSRQQSMIHDPTSLLTTLCSSLRHTDVLTSSVPRSNCTPWAAYHCVQLLRVSACRDRTWRGELFDQLLISTFVSLINSTRPSHINSTKNEAHRLESPTHPAPRMFSPASQFVEDARGSLCLQDILFPCLPHCSCLFFILLMSCQKSWPRAHNQSTLLKTHDVKRVCDDDGRSHDEADERRPEIPLRQVAQETRKRSRSRQRTSLRCSMRRRELLARLSCPSKIDTTLPRCPLPNGGRFFFGGTPLYDQASSPTKKMEHPTKLQTTVLRENIWSHPRKHNRIFPKRLSNHSLPSAWELASKEDHHPHAGHQTHHDARHL